MQIATTQKHAYLIMIHNRFEQVEKLVEMLDSEFHDIFVHVDKKASFSASDEKRLRKCVKRSKVCFIERISVRWGGRSQLQCEYNLFRAASKGKYRYYHILSGNDLPLVPANDIYDFFEKNYGKEFVQFVDEKWNARFQKRVKYWWLFSELIGDPKIAVRNIKVEKMFLLGIQRMAVSIQKFMRIDRCKKYSGIVFASGSNWVSVTDDFVQYLMKKECWAMKVFQHTLNSDELFLQTIMRNSEFYDRRYLPEQNDCACSQRYLDWIRGGPYCFQDEDIEELVGCGCVFARKVIEEDSPKLFEFFYKRNVMYINVSANSD